MDINPPREYFFFQPVFLGLCVELAIGNRARVLLPAPPYRLVALS